CPIRTASRRRSWTGKRALPRRTIDRVYYSARGVVSRRGRRMSLVELNLPVDRSAIPGDVRAFLREATRRVEQFQRDSRLHAFVPSDFEGAYAALHALAESDLAPGTRFCEWGSGFGVVTCLAAMLEFDACGIEVEPELVDAARRLADDFDVAAEFVRGSFIPPGGEVYVEHGGGFSWLTVEAEEAGYTPDEFDVIFAYPWP